MIADLFHHGRAVGFFTTVAATCVLGSQLFVIADARSAATALWLAGIVLWALITYGVLHVEGDAEPAVQRFYSETVGPYWPPERRHVEDGYRSLPFPFREITFPSLSIEVSWTLADLLGYIGTVTDISARKAAEDALRLAELESRNAAVALQRQSRISDLLTGAQALEQVSTPLLQS